MSVTAKLFSSKLFKIWSKSFCFDEIKNQLLGAFQIILAFSLKLTSKTLFLKFKLSIFKFSKDIEDFLY